MLATLITALYLSHVITPGFAANFLFVAGLMMLAGEFMIPTLGIMGLNAAMALLLGYMIYTGQTDFYGITLDWGLFFGLAFAEAVILAAVVFIFLRQRGLKLTTGTESMLGARVQVVEWHGQGGVVRAQGEMWKARIKGAIQTQPAPGQTLRIAQVDGLTLIVEAE